MYPRTIIEGTPVSDKQLVTVREHLSREHRIVFISGQFAGDTEIHNALMALDSVSDEPIKLVITSPGGDVDSAFLLYDTIRLMKCPVYTLGRYCASAAALILASGAKRYLMPHAKVMLHLISGQAYGDMREWEIQHKQMTDYMDKMVDILLECGVKKPRAEILKDIDRDYWMNPQEAIEYGLADEVMDRETMKEWLT